MQSAFYDTKTQGILQQNAELMPCVSDFLS